MSLLIRFEIFCFLPAPPHVCASTLAFRFCPFCVASYAGESARRFHLNLRVSPKWNPSSQRHLNFPSRLPYGPLDLSNAARPSHSSSKRFKSTTSLGTTECIVPILAVHRLTVSSGARWSGLPSQLGNALHRRLLHDAPSTILFDESPVECWCIRRRHDIHPSIDS